MFAHCSLEETQSLIASLTEQAADSTGRMVVIYYGLKTLGYEAPITQGACAALRHELSVLRTIQTVDSNSG